MGERPVEQADDRAEDVAGAARRIAPTSNRAGLARARGGQISDTRSDPSRRLDVLTLMRWLGGAVVGLATALLLGACTGQDRSPAPGSADAPSAESPEAFAPADVTFLTNMVGHHRQAAELAETALGRTAGPQLSELAASIAAAHNQRLDTIRSLLTQAEDRKSVV